MINSLGLNETAVSDICILFYRQLYKDSGLDFDTLEEQAIALNKSIKMYNYVDKKYQLQSQL